MDSCTGSTGSQRSLGALEERSVVIVVEMYDRRVVECNTIGQTAHLTTIIVSAAEPIVQEYQWRPPQARDAPTRSGYTCRLGSVIMTVLSGVKQPKLEQS